MKTQSSSPVYGSASPYSTAQKVFIGLFVCMALCAVAIFIWLLVRASCDGSARGVLMASALILGSVGLLAGTLLWPLHRRMAWLVLYLTVPLAVAAAVVSLYVDGGATSPNVQEQQAVELYETVNPRQ